MGKTQKSSNKNSPRISRLGIGPFFAGISICYYLATMAATTYLVPQWRINMPSPASRYILAAILILPGLSLYGLGVKNMLSAYKNDKLCTTGAFGICRHPIYSAWIFFLVPGLSLWVNSPLSFTTPPIMYILFKVLIKKEDRYLEERFAAEYLHYRKTTPEILPVGWFTKTAKKARS